MSLKIDSAYTLNWLKFYTILELQLIKMVSLFWSEMTDHVAAGNEGSNHNDYDRGQGCILNANRQAMQFMQNSGKTF